MLILPKLVHDQMVAHCLTGLPDEACGLLGGDLDTGKAVTCYPTRNLAASAKLYTVDPEGAPAGRPGRRGRRAFDHRGLPLPHPHRGLSVAHRRGPGSRSRLALRAGLPAGHPTGGAELPDRRRGDHRGTGPSGARIESQPKQSTFAGGGRPDTDRAQREPEENLCPSKSTCRPSCGHMPEEPSTVSADGSTVGEVLESLVAEYPGLSGQVIDDDGSLHKFVNVYLNDDDVRYLSALDTPVGDSDEISILPAVAGGAVVIAVVPTSMTRFGSVLELIGNTPLVDITALSPNPDVRILIKLEGQNPGGSVKDRIALSMIEEAEKDGILKPGQTLIEPSSGNTGIGMAMVCKLKGYHLKVVLADNVSIERRQLLEVWGAEIIESPGSEGSNGAVRRAQALAAEHPEWAFLYQYANPANPKAHYEGTGPEIWRDCPEVTHFVAGLGTSGTLLGVGRYLKEQNPDIQVWAIEPPAGETVDGLRNLDDGYIPPIFIDNGGAELLDGKRIVRPRESIEWTRRLTDVGIFAGLSSGAALAGAAKTGRDRRHRGPSWWSAADGGWKYLSTGAWTDDLDVVEERASSITYF